MTVQCKRQVKMARIGFVRAFKKVRHMLDPDFKSRYDGYVIVTEQIEINTHL